MQPSVLVADDDYRALWGQPDTQPQADRASRSLGINGLAALLLPWKSETGTKSSSACGMGLSSILGMEPGTSKDALNTFLYHMEGNATYAFCILEARIAQALSGSQIDFRTVRAPELQSCGATGSY